MHIISYHACIPTKLTTDGCVILRNGLLNLFPPDSVGFCEVLVGSCLVDSSCHPFVYGLMIFVSEVGGKLESMRKASPIRHFFVSVLIFWRFLGEF